MKNHVWVIEERWKGIDWRPYNTSFAFETRELARDFIKYLKEVRRAPKYRVRKYIQE